MKPEVSLIIPIYNAERFLERCLNSLFTQSLTNIEYLFVDDCSTDNSIEVLEKTLNNYLEKREQVKLIRHKINKGVAASRNSGLENATGKYVGWVDADDYVDAKMFEKMFSIAEINQADLMWCNYFNVSFEGKIKEVKQKYEEDAPTYAKGLILNTVQGNIWNKIIKRSLFEEHKIKFIEGLDVAEDYNVLFKILHFSRNIIHLNESLYYYCHNNPDSLSKQLNSRRIYQALGNAKDMIKFIQDKNVDIYSENELNRFKFLSKRKLLLSLKIDDFKSWSIVFPESNYLVNSDLLTPAHNFLGRIVLAEKWGLVKIWIIFKRIKNKFLIKS